MKSIMQKWGVTFFILTLSVHLYAQVLGESYSSLQLITKALLLPTLILFLIAQDGFSKYNYSKWFIIIALFGSFLGDLLLSNQASQLFKGVDSFIIGMVAFMTTHIFNIIFFHKQNGIGQTKSKKFKMFSIILLAFCVLIFFQLKSAMGSLIYPILVYMVLICSAALMAIQAGVNTKATLISKLFWFPGMLFFITSDTVLAFNKFSWEKSGMHIQNIGLVTMLTYGIAQLLLVKGFQLYFKQQVVIQN
jgi:uncharacterized membrane protein YhhN